MSPSPETIKEVYVKKYREGYQLPDDRIMRITKCYVQNDSTLKV